MNGRWKYVFCNQSAALLKYQSVYADKDVSAAVLHTAFVKHTSRSGHLTSPRDDLFKLGKDPLTNGVPSVQTNHAVLKALTSLMVFKYDWRSTLNPQVKSE